jgi:hypothetical protein
MINKVVVIMKINDKLYVNIVQVVIDEYYFIFIIHLYYFILFYYISNKIIFIHIKNIKYSSQKYKIFIFP